MAHLIFSVHDGISTECRTFYIQSSALLAKKNKERFCYSDLADEKTGVFLSCATLVCCECYIIGTDSCQ